MAGCGDDGRAVLAAIGLCRRSTCSADQTIGGTALNLMAPALVLFFIRMIANQNTLQMATGDSAGWFMIKKSMLGYGRTDEAGLLCATRSSTRCIWPTYLCLLVYVILSIILYKTRFGLRLRSCGENPQAADSLGINVFKMRYAGVTISGALAGMGGFVYAHDHGQLHGQRRCGGLRLPGAGGYDFRQLEAPATLRARRCCSACSSAWRPAYASLDVNGDGVYLLEGTRRSTPTFYRLLPYVITLVVLAFTSKSSRAPESGRHPLRQEHQITQAGQGQ